MGYESIQEIINLLSDPELGLTEEGLLKQMVYKSKLLAGIRGYDGYSQSLSDYLDYRNEGGKYKFNEVKLIDLLKLIGFEHRTGHFTMSTSIEDWQSWDGSEYSSLIMYKDYPPVAYTVQWHNDESLGCVLIQFKELSQTFEETFKNYNLVIGSGSDEETAWHSAAIGEVSTVPWNIESYLYLDS